MNSYFDEASQLVREASETFAFDHDFLLAVQGVEKGIYEDVVLVIDDREFPDDLRNQIRGVLVVEFVYQPGDLPAPEQARLHVVSCRYSQGIETLHQIFDNLATRRHATRFGLLNDNPNDILVRRAEVDDGFGDAFTAELDAAAVMRLLDERRKIEEQLVPVREIMGDDPLDEAVGHMVVAYVTQLGSIDMIAGTHARVREVLESDEPADDRIERALCLLAGEEG